jgi:hypothetical protein
VKADPYDNKRNETMYFYTDNDTQLQQLDGKSSYEVTFPKGQLPPVLEFEIPCGLGHALWRFMTSRAVGRVELGSALSPLQALLRPGRNRETQRQRTDREPDAAT